MKRLYNDGWRPGPRSATTIAMRAYMGAFVGFLIYSAYLNAERPRVADIAQGFTVPRKLVVGIVYLSQTENNLINYVPVALACLFAITAYFYTRRR